VTVLEEWTPALRVTPANLLDGTVRAGRVHALQNTAAPTAVLRVKFFLKIVSVGGSRIVQPCPCEAAILVGLCD